MTRSCVTRGGRRLQLLMKAQLTLMIVIACAACRGAPEDVEASIEALRPAVSVCGNGRCQRDETCSSCPADCGPCESCPGECIACCGNGTCDHQETCSSCPTDCGACVVCGDGTCSDGETCSSCPVDCPICPRCGDLLCNGDETCASCPGDCEECPACGDGKCNGDETCATCPGDCGGCSPCGDGSCAAGEDPESCPSDCGGCQPACDSCGATQFCAGIEYGAGCPVAICADALAQCGQPQRGQPACAVGQVVGAATGPEGAACAEGAHAYALTWACATTVDSVDCSAAICCTCSSCL
jgi:hypothetical protein